MQPTLPFAAVEPTFLAPHDPERCRCPECGDTREAAEFLAFFEANGLNELDYVIPDDPDGPTEADREAWALLTRDEPAAADLVARDEDLAAWAEVYRQLEWLAEFEAGYRPEPEQQEAVEIRGRDADTDPTLFF